MSPRRVVYALSLLLCMSCSSDSSTTGPLFAGTYLSTTFEVTPPGQAVQNVIAAGGSLRITITANGITSGTLHIPASIAGGTDFVEDMTGTATLIKGIVTFDQGADTFVRDLAWSFSADGLSAMNEVAGGARYNVLLTRQ